MRSFIVLALFLFVGRLFATVPAPVFTSEVAGATCTTTDSGYQLSGWSTGLTGFTLTAEVDIPESGTAQLISWLGEDGDTGSHIISFTVAEGQLQGYWYTTGKPEEAKPIDNVKPQPIKTGRRVVTVRYGRTANCPDTGVAVWIDGESVYRQSTLRFSTELITKINVGDTTLNVNQIDLEDHWQVLTCSDPNVTITLPGPENAEVLRDGTLKLKTVPITLTVPNNAQCTSFSVELLAQLPQGVSGALIGGQVAQKLQNSSQTSYHTVQAEVANAGYQLYYNGTNTPESTTNEGLATDTSWNAYALSYSDQTTDNLGTHLAVNGETAVQAPGIVWTGAPVVKITIGNDATNNAGKPLTGLLIRRAVVTLHQAAIATDPWSTLCSFPPEMELFSSATKHQLYNQLMTARGELALGNIRVNGASVDTLDAVRVALCLGTATATDVDLSFQVNELTMDAEQGLALHVASSHEQVGGTLALLARDALTEPWSRVAVYSAPFEKEVTLLYDTDAEQPQQFFKVRMEQEEKPLGLLQNFWNAPADCDPFPSMPQTTSETLTFVSRLTDEATLSSLDAPLELVLEGEALREGMLVTLSHGAQQWTATLQAVDNSVKPPRGHVVFETVTPPTTFNTRVTLTVSSHTHGGLTIVGSSWGNLFEDQHRRIAAQLATDLVADGFVEQQYVDNKTWTPEDRSTTNDNQLFYRIPAMATDGKGLIHVAYDVRYGGGDLGDQRFSGIDLGGNVSTDGGRTWSKPFLAVDTPNFRAPDGSWPYGKDRSKITRALDIGDATMLYDPETETFWLMGITGGGLLDYAASNDCVLYKRSKQDSVWVAWDGGLEDDHPRSVKKMLVNALGRETASPGILQGPGHGMVTRIGSEGMPVGTLVFPMQGFVNGSTYNAQCFAAYSTDHGATWQTTALTPHTSTDANAQENSLVELDDGSWLMMCKGGTWGEGKGRRLFYRSTDHENWTQLASDTGIIHVQGSILRIGTNADGTSRYVKCHQVDPNQRAKLTLIFGRDLTQTNTTAASEGIAWDCGSLEVYREATNAQGYNTLCMIDDQTLGLCYESQGIIWFERIDISSYLR